MFNSHCWYLASPSLHRVTRTTSSSCVLMEIKKECGEEKKKKSLTRESRIGLHTLPICPDQNGCLGCEASELKLGVFGKQRVCHPCLKAWMPAPVQMFLLYWFAVPFFYIEWVGLDQRLYNVWSEAKCSPCIKFVWATP